MYKFKSFLFTGLLAKVFNKLNFTKVIVIFSVGFISRCLVNYLFGLNVFLDYTNIISCLYYVGFSIFIVLVHDLVEHFGFNIVPYFVLDFIVFISNKITFLYNNVNNLNFKSIKLLISYIKYSLNFTTNPMPLNGTQSNTSKSIYPANKNFNDNLLFANDNSKQPQLKGSRNKHRVYDKPQRSGSTIDNRVASNPRSMRASTNKEFDYYKNTELLMPKIGGNNTIISPSVLNKTPNNLEYLQPNRYQGPSISEISQSNLQGVGARVESQYNSLYLRLDGSNTGNNLILVPDKPNINSCNNVRSTNNSMDFITDRPLFTPLNTNNNNSFSTPNTMSPLFPINNDSSISTPSTMSPLFPVNNDSSITSHSISPEGVNINKGTRFSYISRATRPSYITNSVASSQLSTQNSKSNSVFTNKTTENALDKYPIYNSIENRIHTDPTSKVSFNTNTNKSVVGNNNSYTEFVDMESRKLEIKDNVARKIQEHKNKTTPRLYHTGNKDSDWYANKRLVKDSKGKYFYVPRKK
jgi:hypothetical protein